MESIDYKTFVGFICMWMDFVH